MLTHIDALVAAIERREEDKPSQPDTVVAAFLDANDQVQTQNFDYWEDAIDEMDRLGIPADRQFLMIVPDPDICYVS